MSWAVLAPWTVWAAWSWNVVHRKAPGAISAMALTVIPVRVRVRFISPAAMGSAMELLSVSLSGAVPRAGGGLERGAALARDRKGGRFRLCQARVNNVLREVPPPDGVEVAVELVDGRDAGRQLEGDDLGVADAVEVLAERPEAVAVGGHQHGVPGPQVGGDAVLPPGQEPDHDVREALGGRD